MRPFLGTPNVANKKAKGHYLALLRSWPLLLDGYCTLVFQMPSEVNGVWMVCFWGPVIPPHQVVWNPRGTSSEPFRNCQGDRVLSRTESSVFSKVAVFNYPSSDPKDPWDWNIYLHSPKKTIIHVGKCTSPMGPVGEQVLLFQRLQKKHQHRCAPSPGGIEEGGHIAPIYKRQTIEGPSVACLQRGNNENKQTSKQTNKQTNQNQNQSQTKPNQQQKHDLISVSVILMSLLPSNSLSFITGRVVMDQVIWTHLSYKLKIWIPSVVGKLMSFKRMFGAMLAPL